MKNGDKSEECEYLIGDDACSAVKEGEVSSLRAEACQNEIKDRCCYKCSVRERCDIRCDLLEHRRQGEDEKQPVTPVSNPDRWGEAMC